MLKYPRIRVLLIIASKSKKSKIYASTSQSDTAQQFNPR
ncbi:hypothetical protein CSUNSWCD_2341 [Campylobacter showae CSUNSWCD]|uniref:Uncharacterized protein n=1 Tax=Campylobacter showae CSUNSWCD TaxID=1244083 RepID=M5IJ24_9BACT|nr:hypothetical protein CSUNSWCD_2341 [Campylobacter showae CSUNSWCD]